MGKKIDSQTLDDIATLGALLK